MRTLGCDYGERRVGLAVSDPDGTLAVALRTVDVRQAGEAVAAVEDAARETDSERVVVGLPLNMNGTDSAMTARVRDFVATLRARLSVPVETWDERLSTGAVERALIEADVSRAKRRGLRDKLAAQTILQGYLDSRAP